MWPFIQTSVAEIESAPAETAGDRRAQLTRECKEAGAALKAAVDASKAYNDEHFQRPFSIRSGDMLFIQTRVDDLQRQRLQSDVRKSAEQWNRAWRELAVFQNPRLIL